MPITKNPAATDYTLLEDWLKQNKKTDLLTLATTDPQTMKATNWKGLEKKQEDLVQQIKAYQRVLKILEGKDQRLIMSLLKSGIHSAIQVGSMPKSVFLTNYGSLFKKKKITAEVFYDRALAIKKDLLLKHVRKIS